MPTLELLLATSLVAPAGLLVLLTLLRAARLHDEHLERDDVASSGLGASPDALA